MVYDRTLRFIILLTLLYHQTLHGGGQNEKPSPSSSNIQSTASNQQSSESIPTPISRLGTSFIPKGEHLENWKNLDSYSLVEAVVLLERMARSNELSREEKNMIFIELGNRYYESKLFELSFENYQKVETSFLTQQHLLRIAELGTYYMGWPPNKNLSLLRLIDRRKLKGRDAEIFQLLLSRSLWKKIDLRIHGLTEMSLSALAIDGDDIWGGSWNGGIFRFSRSSQDVRVFRPGQYKTTPNAITSIYVDRFGIWFAGLEGIIRFNKVTGEWSTILIPEEIQPERIQKFYRFGGKFYLATVGQGLWSLQNNSWSKIPLELIGQNINGIFERDGETVFIGTRDRGLFIWNPVSNQVESLSQYPRSPRNVTTVLQTSNTLWVGTFGEGLFAFDLQKKEWFRYQQSDGKIPDDWVMSLDEHQKNILIGTFGGGLVIWNQTLGFQPLKDIGSPIDVVSLLVSRDMAYLGTLQDGLWILDLKGFYEIFR